MLSAFCDVPLDYTITLKTKLLDKLLLMTEKKYLIMTCLKTDLWNEPRKWNTVNESLNDK